MSNVILQSREAPCVWWVCLSTHTWYFPKKPQNRSLNNYMVPSSTCRMLPLSYGSHCLCQFMCILRSSSRRMAAPPRFAIHQQKKLHPNSWKLWYMRLQFDNTGGFGSNNFSVSSCPPLLTPSYSTTRACFLQAGTVFNLDHFPSPFPGRVYSKEW